MPRRLLREKANEFEPHLQLIAANADGVDPASDCCMQSSALAEIPFHKRLMQEENNVCP